MLKKPSFKNRKFRIPKIWVPRISIPRFGFSLPKIPKPVFTRPRLPRPRLPKLHVPRIALAMPSLPRISLPQFSAPHMTPPKISWPQLALPRISLPHISLPRLPKPYASPALNFVFYSNVILAVCCLCIFLGMSQQAPLSRIHTAIESLEPQKILALVQNQNIDFIQEAQALNEIEPAIGDDYNIEEPGQQPDGSYPVLQDIMHVEAVLIPHATTVISSSHDNKIKAINFENGQLFNKGDILVEYECKDLQAEVDIARMQQNLAQKKSATSYKLFKLDIISDIEKAELETEHKEAEARISLYQSRMENCYIRAEYDGRVVKRLANAGEFTRTDRVLMEVASLDYLRSEFLLPSKWLRWVNIGSPIQISIAETSKTYDATIEHIYGEVDPLTQSIQMTAQLSPYTDRLLPGMSGKASIDIETIRQSGIHGFLEQPASAKRP